MTYLTRNQLYWLEEKLDGYVEIYKQPQGKQFLEGTKGELVRVSDLDKFINDHPLENLWRSWIVYKDLLKSHPIGELPAIIDIDDESDNPLFSTSSQTTPNLQKAYDLTQTCLNIIIEQWAKTENHVRIIFSGHKGFHIELKPSEPVNIATIRKELIEACARKGLVNVSNTFFETTSIDSIHGEVRLTGSINSWQDNKGNIKQRKAIQLTPNEFLSLKLEGILLKSEFIS